MASAIFIQFTDHEYSSQGVIMFKKNACALAAEIISDASSFLEGATTLRDASDDSGLARYRELHVFAKLLSFLVEFEATGVSGLAPSWIHLDLYDDEVVVSLLAASVVWKHRTSLLAPDTGIRVLKSVLRVEAKQEWPMPADPATEEWLGRLASAWGLAFVTPKVGDDFEPNEHESGQYTPAPGRARITRVVRRGLKSGASGSMGFIVAPKVDVVG